MPGPPTPSLRSFLVDDDRSQVFHCQRREYKCGKGEKQNLFSGVGLELDIHIRTEGAGLEGACS